MRKCKIVCVEGADQTGKETQSKLLKQAFLNAGYVTTSVEIPTKLCPRSHKLIYKMLADGTAKRFPNVFQFVQFVNKALFQLNVLPGLLQYANIIILDRWDLSTIIYGNATGANSFLTKLWYRLLKKPDVTLVFYGKSFKRSNTIDDSYEKDTDLQTNVKKSYYDWAVAHPENHVLVNNAGTIESIHKGILIDLCMKNVP